MKRWFVASAVAGVLPIVAVMAMSFFSRAIAKQQRVWQELDVELSTAAKLAALVSDLWLMYWFLSLPLVLVGIGLAIAFAVVGFRERPASNN